MALVETLPLVWCPREATYGRSSLFVRHSKRAAVLRAHGPGVSVDL